MATLDVVVEFFLVLEAAAALLVRAAEGRLRHVVVESVDELSEGLDLLEFRAGGDVLQVNSFNEL